MGAALTKPVQLTFDGTGGPDGALPVVLHHDAELGWYPIDVGEPGQPVVTERTSLSPFAIGWITAPLEWLTNHVVGRQQPPKCPVAAPAWAQATTAKVDLVTSCLAEDADEALLTVRSNRGMPMEITVPPGARSVAVAGQPHVVRQVLSAVMGADKVLLLAGQELTVRWAQPDQFTEVSVRAAFTPTSVLPGVAAEALGFDDSQALLQLATLVARCGGSQQQAQNTLGTPDSLSAALNFLIECIGPVTTQSGSGAAAVPIIAALKGVPESIVIADKAFAGDVDRLANGLRVLGKVLKFYTVAKLVFALGQVVADSIAPEADRTVQLRLTGSRSVTFTGYAGIRLGMTADEALKASAVTLQQKRSQPCTYLEEPNGNHINSMWVLLNRGGKVLGIGVPPDARTDRGIGVRSSLAAARSAYQGLPIEEGFSVSGYFLIVHGPVEPSVSSHPTLQVWSTRCPSAPPSSPRDTNFAQALSHRSKRQMRPHCDHKPDHR